MFPREFNILPRNSIVRFATSNQRGADHSADHLRSLNKIAPASETVSRTVNTIDTAGHFTRNQLAKAPLPPQGLLLTYIYRLYLPVPIPL